MKKQHKKESFGHLTLRLFMIIVGAGLAAGAIELLLIPNKIIDGGIIGVSLILNYLLGDNSIFFSFAFLVVLLNIPFMYFGYKQIGKTFTISSLFGIVWLALIESTLHNFTMLEQEPLLATVFGGLMLGAGVGLVIRHGGSLDGTEILGILISKKIPFSVGEIVMFINIFVFGAAIFVYGLEQAMYSMMTYFIAYKTIDMVIQGLDETKACFIVTDHYDELSEAIQARLGRGITALHGEGGYTKEDKKVIYVVITRLEVTKLKSIIYETDESAFLTIMDTQETKGAKFKSAIH